MCFFGVFYFFVFKGVRGEVMSRKSFILWWLRGEWKLGGEWYCFICLFSSFNFGGSSAFRKFINR